MNEVEKSMIARAKGIIKNPELPTQLVMLLHYVRYSSIRKQNVMTIIKSLFDTLKNNLPQEIQKYFPDLAMTLTGYTEGKEVPQSQRPILFLHIFINMCIPSLKEKLDLLERLLRFGSTFIKTGSNEELMQRDLPQIIDDISTLLGINPKLIKGIFGIMKNDTDALVNFIAPICKIDPSTIREILSIFDRSQTSVDYVMKDKSKSDKKIDDVQRSQWLGLMKKVTDGEAGARELFQLVDMEGDNSGGINTKEFMRLMNKLNMPMTEHRVHEVFSHVQSKFSKKTEELDVQGISQPIIS